MVGLEMLDRMYRSGTMNRQHQARYRALVASLRDKRALMTRLALYQPHVALDV
jgi:hypothetical protein